MEPNVPAATTSPTPSAVAPSTASTVVNTAAAAAAPASSAQPAANRPTIVLPVSIVGRVDVGRLLREVTAVNEFMNQAEIRQPGTAMQLPKSSRLMDEVVQANKLNLLHKADRQHLLEYLEKIKLESPVMHMSFSADPSPHFMNQLIKRLRQSLHPSVLISVGLQPTIGAGCVIRTTNKYFDLSLRHDLTTKKATLMRTLRSAIGEQAPDAPQLNAQPAQAVTSEGAA